MTVYFAACVRKITLRFAIQITHGDVILRTHGPKYCHSNDHSNCAIQITHRDVILRTHGPKYRHSNDHSIQIKIKIAQFCSPVKTVYVTFVQNCIHFIATGKYVPSKSG